MVEGTQRAPWAARGAVVGVSLSLALTACTDDGDDTAATDSSAGAAGSAGTAGSAGAAGSAGVTFEPSDAGPFGFRRDVYPIFVQYCGDCHSVNGPYHNIASPDLAEAYADAVEFAERIVIKIQQGSMPPACVFDEAACVPADALAIIEHWIERGTPE